MERKITIGVSHSSSSREPNFNRPGFRPEFIQGMKEAPRPIQHLFAHELEFTAGLARYEKLFEYFDDDSGNSTRHAHRHPLHVPEVRIDMPRILLNSHVDCTILQENGQDIYIVAHQDQWKQNIDNLKDSKSGDNYDSMKIMFGTLTVVAGQVVGGLMANRLTAGSSWPGLAVELTTVLGLSVAIAGFTLCGKRKSWALPNLMIKFGAMAIASAIICSMGLHLPPGIAWIVGPSAFLIMAVAVAFV